ncbi:MAG TPA: tetratricopeptide repeat protein, partial [Vicinamibacterales bacterium]|nr:tetratricopeptide repeat protein [Vicinamibacterales bacterium]
MPQDRARTLALAQDFGAEALELNRSLVATNPEDAASRTRLARCLLEAARLDEAEAEYQEALRLDPRNRIAAGGLETIVRQRRLADGVPEPATSGRGGNGAARSPQRRSERSSVASPRPAAAPVDGEPAPQIFSGFARRDFTELALARRGEIRQRFAPRVLDLVRRVNALGSSREIAGIREAGRRQLFRLGRADVHVSPAHWYVFNLGGRWEPQFNIGMYGGNSKAGDWLRIGIGFNLTDEGGDSSRVEGLRQVHARFRKFQALLESPRRSLFLGWMIKENGLVQLDEGGPRLDLADPSDAAGLFQQADPERTEWAFFGKWLSPDREDDVAVLGDPVTLVRTVDHVFTGML